MRFDEEDLFVDPEAGRALISWTCHLETARGPAAWRGLDILCFSDDGRIAEKRTYAKARTPLLVADEAGERSARGTEGGLEEG